MNRWFGDSSKSSQQASERNQRAARKTLREQAAYQSVSEDEELEFHEANNSLSISLNVDGGADSDSGSYGNGSREK